MRRTAEVSGLRMGSQACQPPCLFTPYPLCTHTIFFG